MKKTLEQRIAQAERILKMFVIKGRKYRKEFRESVNILINAQIATEDQLKRTGEQIKRTDEQLGALTASQVRTDEAIGRLTASQAKTEASLDRFINSLAKGRNGNSSD